MTRSPIRYSRETDCLEYRCEHCSLRGNAAWWPLTPEFWDYNRAWTRCRACWKSYDRARMRAIRLDPEQRERDRAYARAYYAEMTVAERRAARAKKRAYHREWMRAYRARKREEEAA